MTDISIKNIHTFLSGEGKTLTGEEEKFLNTIFKDVDKEDKSGKAVKDGDGFLNNTEWTMFKTTLKTFGEAIYSKLNDFINQTNDNIEYDYNKVPVVFDFDMYTDKALKKAFPESKYEILDSLENDGIGVTIIDKKTGKEVLKINHLGNLIIEINNKKFSYNRDNTLAYEEDLSTKEQTWYKYEGSRLVEKSNNETKVRYNTNGEYSVSDFKTGERVYYDKNNKELKRDLDFEAYRTAIRHCFNRDYKCIDEQGFRDLLSKINDTNALDILGYPRLYNTINLNLACLNNKEYNPNADTSDLITMDVLYEKAVNQAGRQGVYTKDLDLTTDAGSYYLNKLDMRRSSEPCKLEDTPITKYTKIEQGVTGNCWLLDKISILASTDDGLKILNDMYIPQRNPDGSLKSVIVKVQGREYDIPIDEINGANELSARNLYVRAIEIGVFKYLQELGLEHTYGYDNDMSAALLGMNGAPSSLGTDILVGDGVELRDNTGSLRKVVDKTKRIDDNFMQELFNTQNAIIGVATTKENCKAYVMETGEFEAISPNHAYAVINKDNDYIYIIEPSNNKKTLRMTYDEFKNCFEVGDITEIKSPQKESATENMPETMMETEKSNYSFENIIHHMASYYTKEDWEMLKNPETAEKVHEKYINIIKENLNKYHHYDKKFPENQYYIEVSYNGIYYESNVYQNDDNLLSLNWDDFTVPNHR